MPAEYFTVRTPGSGEVTEKRSRFISVCVHVDTEEEAISYIEKMKKKYYDARHNCWAYILGDKKELQRSSDDGEPSGTAGKPILDAMLTAGLSYSLIVVTRYFGGTLLGTGGLVRAYSTAAAICIDSSEKVKMVLCDLLSIRTDYTGLGRLTHFFEKSECRTLPPVFASDVTLRVLCPVDNTSNLIKGVSDLTSGTAPVTIEARGCYEF